MVQGEKKCSIFCVSFSFFLPIIENVREWQGDSHQKYKEKNQSSRHKSYRRPRCRCRRRGFEYIIVNSCSSGSIRRPFAL